MWRSVFRIHVHHTTLIGCCYLRQIQRTLNLNFTTLQKWNKLFLSVAQRPKLVVKPVPLLRSWGRTRGQLMWRSVFRIYVHHTTVIGCCYLRQIQRTLNLNFTTLQKWNKLFLSVAQRPKSGQSHLIIDVSTSHAIRRTHARTHTHTHGRTPLNKGSARRRGRYLHNTQQTIETNIYVFKRMGTHDPNNQTYALYRTINGIGEVMMMILMLLPLLQQLLLLLLLLQLLLLLIIIIIWTSKNNMNLNIRTFVKQ